MFRTLVPVAAIAAILCVATPAARACDDNSDMVVVKLRKLDLTTDQLKTVFAYQREHKDFITKAHKEGLGCLAHEQHSVVFEKQAIGILDDSQFKKYAGRERNETESLRYQNYLLKAEVERLKAEVEKLKADVEAKAKEPKKA